MAKDGLPARRGESELPAERVCLAAFQVTGKDGDLWKRLRVSFVAKVERIVEQLVEEDVALNWLQEQAKEFGTLALEHAKAKLRKAGVEADKVEAEASKLFAEKEKVLAEARKVNAEARAVEIENSIRELRLALGMTKAMLIDAEDETAVMFGLQIDAMLEAIKVASSRDELTGGK